MTRLLEKWAVDPPLVFAIFAMTLFGIAMIYSAGVVHIPNAVTQDAWVKQAAWFAIALVVNTVLDRVPLRWIAWVAVPSYVVGVLLLAITLVIGTGAGTAIGVKSWIRIGGFGFQPSEFAKPALIVLAAWMFVRLRHFWGVFILGGAGLFSNLTYLPPNTNVLLWFWLFTALLLVARVQSVRRRRGWEARNIRYDGHLGFLSIADRGRRSLAARKDKAAVSDEEVRA